MLALLFAHKADLLALSSALVALASFFVSFLNYRRDQGRLDVKVGIWQEVKHSLFRSSSGRKLYQSEPTGNLPR
jgi:hypothetical protein